MGLYKNSGIKEVDFVEIKNNYLKNLVSNMTLDEKIGQLFTVICEGGIYLPAMESLIADYHCGGLRVVPAVRYSQKLFVDKAKRQQGKEREERIRIEKSIDSKPVSEIEAELRAEIEKDRLERQQAVEEAREMHVEEEPVSQEEDQK